MRGSQGRFTMALVSLPFLLYPLMLPPCFDALLCATSNLFQHCLGGHASSLAYSVWSRRRKPTNVHFPLSRPTRYRNIPFAALHRDTETFWVSFE
ncbi:hypothetical protein AOQ84DRAFT_11195 [Glonium stellatum]|uniref:Secreted protein n=1 Tax=Glonium stellatum TaxID=574774 RepID=A0A8E2JZ11_9PEZI|nr:hypothetical protein AOQ84DRAFT_11195 [Glonium stellatum]